MTAGNGTVVNKYWQDITGKANLRNISNACNMRAGGNPRKNGNENQ
jgi:hypothetical protein